MRLAHKVAKTAMKGYPTDFIAFDTETKGSENGDQSLILGWVKSSTEEIMFTNSAGFWEFVERNAKYRKPLAVFAHNMAFDLRVVGRTEYLESNGWTVTTSVTEKVFFIKLKKGEKQIWLIDSFNYLASSLADIGESMGMPKGNVDFETATPEELSTYCLQDTRILFDAMAKYIKFCKDNNLGSFSMTISGQAFNAFKHRFMKHDIYVHDRPKPMRLERSAYFGGIVEAFHVGEVNETVHLLDFKSMYPSVMKENRYPVKIAGYNSKDNVVDTSCDAMVSDILQLLIDGYAIVARVKLNVRESSQAMFPVRIDDMSTFPTGPFETSLCTKELERAIGFDVVEDVIEYAWYEQEYIFEDYVDFFWNERSNATDPMWDKLAKMFNNSPYGKWGQFFYEWSEADESEYFYIPEGETSEDCDTGRIYRNRRGVIEVRSEDRVPANDAFPAIAAHVTSNARVKLWDAINQAGQENVFYCDTDSLFVNATGRAKLDVPNNPGLGELDEQGIFSRAIFYTIKDYECFDGEESVRKRISGVRQNAIQIDHNTFIQPRFSGWRASEKANIVEIAKTMSRENRKRIVHDDGTTSPLVLK